MCVVLIPVCAIISTLFSAIQIFLMFRNVRYVSIDIVCNNNNCDETCMITKIVLHVQIDDLHCIK